MREKAGIIDNYGQVSVGAYLKVCEIAKDETRDDLSRQVAILAVLYGVTEDEILDLPLGEYKARAAAASFLETPCENLPRVANKYTLGDLVLIPIADVSKMTAGQYIDFQTYVQQGEPALVEQLSCFLVPEGCDYGRGYDMAEVHAAIRDHLTIRDTLALCGFFLTLWRKSIAATLTSSKREARQIQDKETRKGLLRRIRRAERLLNDGDGLPTSTE